MYDPKAPTMHALAAIHSYHAHVYYDPERTRGLAEALREHIAARFRVQLGRWHDVPVGPHTAAMYQVAFATEVFASFVPWLMLNCEGLDVLVHPNTLPLRIEADQEWPVEANTTPTLAP
jgi:aromatic ring-cleaving dioxygenase